MTTEVSRLRNTLGASDRARLDSYLDDIREIERRIQRIEAHNTSGEPRELPGAPAGVPDSFAEHVKLMFDLQALAFAARHHARVLVQDRPRRLGARLSGERRQPAVPPGVAPRRARGARRCSSRRSTSTTSACCPYFLEKLKSIKEGDADLLDKTLIVYGSPMGNSNVHNHKRCPLFLLGNGGGMLKGGLHMKAPDGTPMANAFLTLADGLGLELQSFGDSTGGSI